MKPVLLALSLLSQGPVAGSGSLPPNHPPLNAAPQAAPKADELLRRLDGTPDMKTRDKPFEISASLGRLYFGQSRYRDALDYYRQAQAKAESARALWFELKKAVGGKALPSAESVGCGMGPDTELASLLEKATQKKTAKDLPAAAACARAALHPLMEVETAIGHLQFLLGDQKAALAAYEHALETNDQNLEARWARAALLFDTKGDDLKALAEVKTQLGLVVTQAGETPRGTQAKALLARTEAAIAVGGASKLPLARAAEPARLPGMAPVLSKETMDAFQNAPRTADMEDRFAKLVETGETALAQGKYQEALDTYKQVMPYQPNNPRLRAGMAWTMVKLNRQPMADNVWRAASEQPQAFLELGKVIEAKGSKDEARAFYQRVAETLPALKDQVAGKY